jgi:hypothetical protein
MSYIIDVIKKYLHTRITWKRKCHLIRLLFKIYLSKYSSLILQQPKDLNFSNVLCNETKFIHIQARKRRKRSQYMRTHTKIEHSISFSPSKEKDMSHQQRHMGLSPQRQNLFPTCCYNISHDIWKRFLLMGKLKATYMSHWSRSFSWSVTKNALFEMQKCNDNVFFKQW